MSNTTIILEALYLKGDCFANARKWAMDQEEIIKKKVVPMNENVESSRFRGKNTAHKEAVLKALTELYDGKINIEKAVERINDEYEEALRSVKDENEDEWKQSIADDLKEEFVDEHAAEIAEIMYRNNPTVPKSVGGTMPPKPKREDFGTYDEYYTARKAWMKEANTPISVTDPLKST